MKHLFLNIWKSCKRVSSVTSWLFFWNAQKSIVSNPKATFNGTTVTGRSKAAKNNCNPPSKVNIEQATAICLKNCFQKTNCCLPNVFPSLEALGLHLSTSCLGLISTISIKSSLSQSSSPALRSGVLYINIHVLLLKVDRTKVAKLKDIALDMNGWAIVLTETWLWMVKFRV